MTVKNIMKIKEEMITDVKMKLSYENGHYDFYKQHDIDRAYVHAHNAFLLYRKVEELKAIDIELLDIDTLRRIEEYIILLRKEDYFDIDEINAFIAICR